MRSEGFKDVMLVLFTITVIAVFLYALIVEPILEHRQASREAEASDAATPTPPPNAEDPPDPPEAPGGS